MTRAAVFLDRDGVINKNIHYNDTGEWESPRTADDVVLHAGVAEAIAKLNQAGFPVFIVSNQPSYAKGKTSVEALQQVDAAIMAQLGAQGTHVTERFYSYEHPNAVVADVPGVKGARKPSPYFLLEAAKTHALDLAQSWMVGDRDTDIACGKAAGTRTIFVTPDHPGAASTGKAADFKAKNLREAVASVILKN